MYTQDQIIEFLYEHNYDLRVNRGSGRWIDQKCTPDVIWSISDFVLNFDEHVKNEFTVKDIWKSDYAKLTIAETYSKPGTDEKSAVHEYNKVFSQPLCMLCYAGIIRDKSNTSRHLYVIENYDVLEYIARNDMNALRFLQLYIDKVLKDSDLYSYFQDFFEHQDTNHFYMLKTQFVNFYHTYTQVKKVFEPKRIFTKVLNPLANFYSKKGTERGHMSTNNIKTSDLMYNRDNFRDVYASKPKEMSRQDWLTQHPEIDVRKGYFEQMMNRAKRTLREFVIEYRGGISEYTQFAENETYTDVLQMHHIFPKNEFPEIMHYIENLIALTPNQHFGFAHPNNNTQTIDLDAQKELLIVKTDSIRENLLSSNEDHIYDFTRFLHVLAVGWDDTSVNDIEVGDYNSVIHSINTHY